MTPALIAWSCASHVPLLFMPWLDELNDLILADKGDSWTEEELKAVMLPPEPSCLNIKAMPTLKSSLTKLPTITDLHVKLINGQGNLFLVAFKKEWRLVDIHYMDTMSLNPDCFRDDKCPVDFYNLHSKDYWSGASNQRF